MTARERLNAGGQLTQLAALGPDLAEKQRVLMEFGARTKCLRNEAGLTHQKLADRCFLRHDHISSIERGVWGPPLQLLLLLADAMDASMTELTEGLTVPTHEAGRAIVLAEIKRQPGIGSLALRQELEWPPAYVGLLVRYLAAHGEIVRRNARWELV
jgi:transcriptional regulator with XRE-family HTH domain